MPLPSLSSLLSYLPTVSLSPLLPLPSNLQQRLVSFLLRKTLGGIVKGGLDSDRIHADIRDGSFAIGKVDIDQQAIAPILESLQTLSFVSGTISQISAKVSYPLAQLSLSLSDIDLVFRVQDRATAEEWLQQSTETLNAYNPSRGRDEEADTMHESMISIAVAQDFIEHELSPDEDAELRASLHLSPSAASAQSDFFLPGAFGGAPVKPGEEAVGEQEVEEVEKTMLAGLIERILARLNVKIGRVNVKLLWLEGDEGMAALASRECENELEIRIEEIEYVGDTGNSEEGNLVGATSHEQSTRAIKATPPQVYLKLAPRSSPSPAHSDSSDSTDSSPSSSIDHLAQSVSFSNSTISRASAPTSSHTLSPESSESESESDSGDDNDLLALSQSIADLRTSTASLSQSNRMGRDSGKVSTGLRSIDESGGSEMFSSATSFVSARSSSLRTASEPTSPEAERDDPFHNPDSPPRAQPPQPDPFDSDETPQTTPSRLIVSLGSPSATERLIFYLTTKRSPQQDRSRSKAILELTSNLESGWIAALTTTQLTSLIHLAHRLVPFPDLSDSASTPATTNSPLNLSILLKSLTLMLAYPDSNSSDSDSCFSTLWNAKDPSNVPATTLKVPHLRFKVDDVGLRMRDGNVEFGVREITLSEVMSEIVGDKQAWKTLPILVSDNGLTKEGNKEIGGDWLIEGAGLGKDWRVKAPSSVGFGAGVRRRASDAKDVLEVQRVKQDAVKVLLDKNGRTEIELSPIHLFIDMRLLSRLSPVLEDLVAAIPTKDSISRDGASTPRSTNPRPQLSLYSRPRTPAYHFSQDHVLNDLSTFPSSRPLDSTPNSSISFKCPLIRIDLRCPAPRRLRVEKEQDNYVRSGIVVVELEGIEVAKRDDVVEGKIKEIRAGIRSRAAPTLSRFLAISSLSPTEPSAVLPSLAFSPTADSSPPTIQCSIPLAHLKLKKATIDTLQLFADDLTQFLNTELSASTLFDGSPAEREREKMIGSRYFGTKSFRGSERFGQAKGYGRESEGETSKGSHQDGLVKLQLELSVTDLVVDLFIPTSPTDISATPIDRHVSVLASDLSVLIESLQDAGDDLRAKVEVGDARIEDVGTDGKDDRRILLGQTVQGNLTEMRTLPAVKVNFSTSADPQTDLKDSKVEVGVHGLTYFFDCVHLDLAQDLGNFVKAPPGVFEQVVPNELTRLRLHLSNLSLHLTPPKLTSQVVVSLGDVTIKSDLMPDLPRTNWAIEVRDAKVWAIESQFDLKDAEPRSDIKVDDAWKAKGYVELVVLAKASIVARQGNGLVLPDTELLVSNAKVQLALCADSIAALTAFSEDVMSGLDLAKAPESSPATANASPAVNSNTKRSTTDLLASVDANAFESAPSIHDLPEFLGDDVPANLDYLAAGLSQRSKKSTRSRNHRSSDASQSERPGRVTENIDGETVRMFGSKGLQIVDEWLSESRCDKLDYSAPSSRTRLRLTNVDISVHLHEGYDWYTTRKAIEEESKAVRRRLEKIRQLLASGQTPDATAENAGVLMFGSHQLGLPPGADEMAPKDLLAAIDEELERGGKDDDAASTTASSWQTFPGGKTTTETGHKKSTAATATVGRNRNRLTRSKAFAIEVNVRGLNTSFDSFSESTSSESSPRPGSTIKVDVSSFDIIDNIKTSTWRKFLTEMRPSDGGLVRATGSPMARVELETMKPIAQVDTAQEEINLKIKISPLRLYIDQDALDFLKAFGAFQAPSSAAPSVKPTSANASVSQEPFYQRVEVFPVKIKLDYKPKRVDYYALKQGKTAELMNFFHFDGSEMILRHLVVTGVSGTTTLSSLVQDIWTPDVKANQLADVISGIAPVRSVVNVGSGVANLVLLPIEQYRKDGRVVRGLQKGAQAFAKQTTLEAINVGAKLANGTQVILEQAEHVLGARFSQRITGQTLDSPRPSTSSIGDTLVDFGDLSDEEIKKVRSRFAEQPADLRQGVESAYKSLGDNFKEAAQTILAVPMEVYERSGNEGPVRAVVRAVPIAVLRPMIGASGAVSKALLGLRNTLDPDQQQGELEDKYKRRPSS